jgi:hypothetical protein
VLRQEDELTSLIRKDPGHYSEFEEVSWVSVAKAGGGVKFYNYVSKKFREAHNDKLSRDVHYKPEARLRIAEDALIAKVINRPSLFLFPHPFFFEFSIFDACELKTSSDCRD